MRRHAVLSYGSGAPEQRTVLFVEQRVIGQRNSGRCSVFATPVFSGSSVAPRHSLCSSLNTCGKRSPPCSPD